MSELPKTQKAAVYDSYHGPIEMREIAVPVPEGGDVLVKIHYSGVCFSDLSIHEGMFPTAGKLPLVPGHEGAGVVVALGPNVTRVKVGDRVGVKWINRTCLNCEYCRAGTEVNCPEGRFTGFVSDGTWQQFALIDQHHAIIVPDNVDLAQAAPILCAGVTVYRALKVADIIAGQTIAITGAGGGLGGLAIQYAKAMGYRVLAIDAAAKKDFCLSVGADLFLDPFASDDLVKDVQKLTAGGPHAVMNLANSVPAMNTSINYVRTRGTVVLVALPHGKNVEFDLVSAVLRVISIRTTYVGTRLDCDEAFGFVARGQVKVPVEVRAFDQLLPTIDAMKKGSLTGRVVLDLWK